MNEQSLDRIAFSLESISRTLDKILLIEEEKLRNSNNNNHYDVVYNHTPYMGTASSDMLFLREDHVLSTASNCGLELEKDLYN